MALNHHVCHDSLPRMLALAPSHLSSPHAHDLASPAAATYSALRQVSHLLRSVLRLGLALVTGVLGVVFRRGRCRIYCVNHRSSQARSARRGG